MSKGHIHFVGVHGSGISGVAAIASSMGYKVTGCDLNAESPYSKFFEKYNITTQVGHSANHLSGVDLVAVSPALLFGKKNEEILEAQKQDKLLTWQEFLGRVVAKNKQIISVSGTHGKSTSTGMMALVLEAAGLDPSTLVGATVKPWATNFRVGESDLFLIESDEFYDNFLNYTPEYIALTNIEYDHPDFFKTREQYWESFEKHVKSLTGEKVLVFNQDDEGIRKLFDSLGKEFLTSINLYGYTLGNPRINTQNSTLAKNIKTTIDGTNFIVVNPRLGLENQFNLKIPGVHNVANAVGVIALSRVLKISVEQIGKVLENFTGVGRRLELISTVRGIELYSDYGHHPTEIGATLSGLRQKYPASKIWSIVEPHSFSRTKALLADYKGVFKNADRVIIAPIFKARDTSDFDVSEEDVVNASGHIDAETIGSFDKIAEKLAKETKKGDVVVVMGAGKSHELADMVRLSLT